MKNALFFVMFILVIGMGVFGFIKIRQMKQEQKEAMFNEKENDSYREFMNKASQLLDAMEAAMPLVEEQCTRIEKALADGVSYEELKEDVAFAEAQNAIRGRCDEFQCQFEALDKSCPDKMTGVNSATGDCFVTFAQWVKMTEEPPTGTYVMSDSRSMMQYTFTSALDMARTVIRNQEAMLKFQDRQKDLLH